jgi:hypothetical protein
LAGLVARSLREGPLALRQGVARHLIERIEFDGTALRLVPKNITIEDGALPRAA